MLNYFKSKQQLISGMMLSLMGCSITEYANLVKRFYALFGNQRSSMEIINLFF